MDESFHLAKSLRAAKSNELNLEFDETKGKSDSFHIEIKDGGPAFDISIVESKCEDGYCKGFQFIRTDKANVEPFRVKADEGDSYYFDDFNFDGYKDIALFDGVAGADSTNYNLMVWNPKTEQFDSFEIYTNRGNVELCEENKTLVLETSAYFGEECPENCLSQYIFDGSTMRHKPWVLPAPKPGVVRVSTKPDFIDGIELEASLVTMEYDLREESDGVHAFLVSCGDSRERAFYRDATLKGMEQKDVNGDGKIDLVFPSKSDPSKKIQAIWENSSRVFVGPDEDVDEEEDDAVG